MTPIDVHFQEQLWKRSKGLSFFVGFLHIHFVEAKSDQHGF